MKYLKVTLTFLFAVVVGLFISAPTKYMQSFFDGITVWAYNVLPALFPFTVLTTLTLKIQPEHKFSVTKKLFGVSCDDIWAASILCGYPIGAKAIADSNADAQTATRISSFCSTAGPVFLIATVGAKLLRNGTATAILLISQILSAILNGMFFRSKKDVSLLSKQQFEAKDFGDTITSSALSVISVGGLIALFYMLSDMVKSFLPAALQSNVVVAFCIGIFEMTNGVFAICNITNIAVATVLCSCLTAFGGVCVFFQCYAFLSQKGVKILDIVKMKLVQAAIATLISFCLVTLAF